MATPVHQVVRHQGLLRRLGHAASVWHYLVALSLLPVLGLVPFVGIFTADRFGQAATASRVARDLTAVEALDRLRIAVADETTASALTVLARRFQVSVNLLNAGLGLPTDVSDAQARTDRALAAVPRTPLVSPVIDDVVPRLAAVRRTVAAAPTGVDQAVNSAWIIGSGYVPVGQAISAAERRTAHEVASGADGVTSRRLLPAIHQLEAISTLVVSGDAQATLFYLMVIAPADQRADLRAELQHEQQHYEVRAHDLDGELSPASLGVWSRLSLDEDAEAFLTAVPRLQVVADMAAENSPPSAAELRAMAQIVPAAKRVTHFTAQLSSFLQQGVREAGTAARVDAADARRRAWQSLAFAGGLLVLTALALHVVGGSLRRRLEELADSAQRLRAGFLDPIPVHGPRELAATSAALNDAVASLREVEVKAELLASGDLDSPELEQPAPGPLGLAVHASVARIVTAVREREELQQQLSHQAAHDGLTDLANRGEIERILAGALARARRTGACVAVLFVDLDRFKECNDRLGHAAGDHVLRVVADRMREQVRQGDTVGRIGGDEFVVVLEGTAPGAPTVEVAERIVSALAAPIRYEHQLIHIGGSVGLSFSENGEADADQLLREADTAVYQAKAAGGGVVEVYDERLRGKLRAQQDLEAAIAAGLHRGEFVLFYQPIVDVTDGRLRGFEALIRWDRPGVGLVPPLEFIPVAETSDLIVDLGRWALCEATRQLVAWSADPLLSGLDVSVNLSGRHLMNPGVRDDVLAALEQSGLEPQRLIVEITETVPMDSLTAIEHLHELSRIGVRIALDDFGTGHTSLSQLLNLPIDILKIDRSFISGHGAAIRSERGSRTIAQLLIEMAHGLNLAVVAEGVEQAVQLEGLVDSNCDDAQGFYFSRPLPAGAAAAWARDQVECDRQQQTG